MADNMRFYEHGRSVPPEAQKQFSNGRFSGTDINPMWRIKTLTEMFGPCGIGWYIEVVSQRTLEVDAENTLCFVDVNLYVKDGGEWSKPIFGSGGNVLKLKGRGDDEGFKKAYTDAVGIACKALGIGADIWFAKDATREGSSKYAKQYSEDEPQSEPPQKEQPKRKVEMIAPGQAKYLLDNMPEDVLKRYQRKYGDDLSGMTRVQAEDGIKWTQKYHQDQGRETA